MPSNVASLNRDGVNGLCRGIVGVVLLCFMALAASAPTAAQDEEAVGQVVRQQGVVTALRTTLARPLHLGAPVLRGDRIITAAEAKVEIAFADGSTLSVGPETSVEIADYTPEARRGGLLLIIGIIRTSLSNLWRGGFEVHTRAAVASLRSTDWITQAREDRSSVFVVDGEVEVTGTADGTSVRLTEGEGTDVEVGGAPSPPMQWGEARVQDVLARTRLP